MKKLFMILAAAALVLGAASCQKENFQKALAEGAEQIDYSDDPMGVIKVYIKKDDTKMAFKENKGEDGKDHLYRSWEDGDVIDGCTPVTENGKTTFKTFSYKVAKATEEYITLTKENGDKGVPSAAIGTQIHFVYAPGAVSFDSETGACSLDLSDQKEGAIPAVMVASGEVEVDEDGNPHLDLTGEKGFKNIAAVIKVTADDDKDKFMDGETEVKEVNVYKAYVKARVKGVLTLGEEGYSLSDAKEADYSTIIEPVKKKGSEDSPFYMAALPGNSKISVILRTDKGKFSWTTDDEITIGNNAYARVNGGNTYTKVAEAEIKGIPYAIEDAFKVANEAEGSTTITLVDDCEPLDELKAEKKIILDLKDHKMTQCRTWRVGVGEGGDLTIKDSGTDGKGEITQNATGSNTISMTSADSELTIEGGKITCATGQTVATVYMTNGTLTMTGGEIIGERVGISMDGDEESSPEVTVYDDAKVTSTASNAVYAEAGTLTIKGGYFKASAAVIYTKAENLDNFEASGGYYNKALNKSYIKVKDGYVCVSEPDDSRPGYNYVVKEFSEVATLTVEGGTSTSFASVDDAVAEANKEENKTKNSTITLTKNSTVGAAATVQNTAGVTLDLNGYELKHIEGNRVGVSGDGILTITDNSDGGEGKIIQTAAGSSTITYSSGNLTIAGGTITKAEGSTYNTINVSGGTLTVTDGATITNNAVQGDNYNTTATIYASKGSVTISGGTVSSSAANAIAISGGELEVTGGQINATGSAGNALYLGEGSTKIKISGGTLSSYAKVAVNMTGKSAHELEFSGDCTVKSTSSNALYSNSSDPQSSVTVTGGKYSSPDNYGAFYSTSSSKTTYTVSSCKFKGSNIAASKLALFYHQVDGTDTNYPKEIKYVPPKTFLVGSGQRYTTVESAMAATDNETADCIIRLLEDCALVAEEGKGVKNTQYAVILDLNDKTLTFNGKKRIILNKNTHLIIEDSGINKTGKINQSGSNVFAVSNGELTINGGEISNTSTAAIYITGGKVVVNGGKITAPGSNAIYAKDGGELTITDGFFKTESSTAGVISRSASTIPFNIYGGYYSKAVNSAYLIGEKYQCVPDVKYYGYSHKVQRITKTN